MCLVDDNQLSDLTASAEMLGFEIFCDQTCGYFLRLIGGATTNPPTQSYVDLEGLRDILDGIEQGREFGPANAGRLAML